MHNACIMSTTITIRDVPDETHAELVARAAYAGKSLQEYLRGELIDLSSRPDVGALMARVRERKAAYHTRLSSEEILEYRDADRK